MTRVGRATAEQSLVYRGQHFSAGWLGRSGALEKQQSRNSTESWYPSALVPSAINRASCGNESESVTVLEGWARSRYA